MASRSAAVVAGLWLSCALAPAAGQDAPFEARGRRTEATQRAFGERLVRFHEALRGIVSGVAPGRLKELDPPQARRTGYQLLPPIVADLPAASDDSPRLTTFSWVWSDTLLARELAALARLEASLARLESGADPSTSARLDALITGYRALSTARQSIDADVAYNRFWQRDVQSARSRYDEATRRIDLMQALKAQGLPVPDDLTSPLPALPRFVQVAAAADRVREVRIAIRTDISDRAFIERFIAAVEPHWIASADGDEYRLRLDVELTTGRALYCPEAISRASATCAPPAVGATLDLAAHIARFPADRAVMTTGAGALHVANGRALVLAPFDVSPRVLAHEVGHLLGFPDAYVRGYRDLGADGFQILEFVPDLSDIMAAPGFGRVQPGHYRRLVAAARP